MAKSGRCHVLFGRMSMSASAGGMIENRDRRISAVAANSVFLVGSVANPGWLVSRLRVREFLEARVLAQRFKHWIQPQQCRSKRRVRG